MGDACLADLLNEKEEEASKLKKTLQELHEDLVKAGEIGNGLLEQKSDLEEMIEKIQAEHAIVVEGYEQEKYSIENKLELMTKMKMQVQSTLQEESQRLKTKLLHTEQQLNRKHNDEITAVKMQLSDANIQLQQEKLNTSQCRDTIKLKDAQIAKLQKELKQIQTSLNDTLSTEVAELSSENCDLKIRLQEMEIAELELSQMRQQLQDKVEMAENNEESLRQAKEDAERETSSYYNSLESCREECRELQAELDLIKLQPNDPNRRGNSLFAEVEDKRIKAEKNLISMKSKYKCMEAQNGQLKHYTLKLKMQISALLDTRSRATDQQHVSSLEESLSIARSDNNKLVQKLKTLQEKLKQHIHDHKLPGSTPVGEESGVLQFFKNELKERNSEVNRLTEELRLNELYLMAETKKVSALERDLYNHRKLVDASMSAKFKQQIEIDRLKLKCGEDVKVKSYQHKWKSERIALEAFETDSAVTTENSGIGNKENVQPARRDQKSLSIVSEKDNLKELNDAETSKTDNKGTYILSEKSIRTPLAERPVDMDAKEEFLTPVTDATAFRENETLQSCVMPPKESSDVVYSEVDSSQVTSASDCKQQ